MKKRRGERKKEKTTDALERVGGFVCGAFSFIYFFFFFLGRSGEGGSTVGNLEKELDLENR